MSVHAASRAWRSGSTWAAGGSCATSVRTCSGYLAARASALTAPPLVAKMSAGPAPSTEISRGRSSACPSGVVTPAPSVRLLRSDRGGVGHDRAVGEVAGQGDESAGGHRRPEQQQRRFGGGLAGPDVVVQHGTRDVQGARRRLGHRECPSREVSSLILTRQAGEIHRAENPATTARVGADVPLGAIRPGTDGAAVLVTKRGAQTGSPTSLPRSSGREIRRLRLAPHPAIAIMPPHRPCAAPTYSSRHLRHAVSSRLMSSVKSDVWARPNFVTLPGWRGTVSSWSGRSRWAGGSAIPGRALLPRGGCSVGPTCQPPPRRSVSRCPRGRVPRLTSRRFTVRGASRWPRGCCGSMTGR